MPIINANISDEAYRIILDLNAKNEKSNKSAVLNALIINGSYLQDLDTQKRIADFEFDTGEKDRLTAVRLLLKQGWIYWFQIRKELQKS